MASSPEALVAMNYPSLQKFEARVIENGLVVLNASLIDETPLTHRFRIVQGAHGRTGP